MPYNVIINQYIQQINKKIGEKYADVVKIAQTRNPLEKSSLVFRTRIWPCSVISRIRANLASLYSSFIVFSLVWTESNSLFKISFSWREMAMGMGRGWDSHFNSHYSREYWEREGKFPQRLYSHDSREFWEWEWLLVLIPYSQEIPKYFFAATICYNNRKHQKYNSFLFLCLFFIGKFKIFRKIFGNLGIPWECVGIKYGFRGFRGRGIAWAGRGWPWVASYQ